MLLFSFTGCRRREPQYQDGLLHVTATIFPAFDFVRNVGGSKINVTMLIPPGLDIHFFEPSPRNIITIQNSDLFVFVGGDMDHWAERILQSINTENMKVLAMADLVDLIEHDEECDEETHGAEGHVCGLLFDEHVWTSPRNAKLIVYGIAELLSHIDPDNSEYFRNNAAAYIAELEKIDAAFTEVVENAVRRTIIFGDRFPFAYFVRDYGLDYMAAFAGCSTDTDPSAQTVAALITRVREEEIPVVFHIELSNARIANTIANAAGAQVRMLHSVHNVTRDDFNAGLGYLDFMRHNVEALREALH